MPLQYHGLGWGWGTYNKIRVGTGLSIDKKILLPLLSGIEPRPSCHESGVLPLSCIPACFCHAELILMVGACLLFPQGQRSILSGVERFSLSC